MRTLIRLGRLLRIRRTGFHPNVEGVNRAAREEMANLPRANDYFYANTLARTHHRLHAIQWADHGSRFAQDSTTAWQAFFADCESS